MIAVIDYDTGNLMSVQNALGRLGAGYTVTGDIEVISQAERVLLPGVGAASAAMEKLRASGLIPAITSLKVPVLGICIGMQLMCGGSEEGDTECMAIFDTSVCKLPGGDGLKVPHMGWNTLTDLQGPLFAGISDSAFVYYVHSYAAGICGDTIAVTRHGIPFSAALNRDNFYGTQFHPEKSGSVGEAILKNFLEL